MQTFRLPTAQVKFRQICTLIASFRWKCIKFQLKKLWRSYVSWYQRVVQNLKRNLIFVSKMTRTWGILIRALKSLKDLQFDWTLLCKVSNVWPKKVQRRYILRHWRVMQNLKKNWLVVLKMRSGIWHIFIKMLENIKIGTFMGSFFSKVKTNMLKIYRGVMCNDNEEWSKTWRGINLSFQNWHNEFDEFWLESLKSLKHLHFNVLLLNKAYNVWALKVHRSYELMALKIDAQLEGKLTCTLTWGIR